MPHTCVDLELEHYHVELGCHSDQDMIFTMMLDDLHRDHMTAAHLMGASVWAGVALCSPAILSS